MSIETLEWPDEIELKLDSIAQGGDAVGRWQERVVFVRGGLPGEQVRVALEERTPQYARGSVAEIYAAAPERIAPRLPGADHISWQHIEYSAQLAFKQQIVAEQLAKLAGLTNTLIDPIRAAAHPWGYRTSARLHSDGQQVGYYSKGQGAAAREQEDAEPPALEAQSKAPSLHAKGSLELMALREDPLLHPLLNSALAALPEALAAAPQAQVKEVILRASETYGYSLGLLRGTGDLSFAVACWRAAVPALAGVGMANNQKFWLTEDVDGLTFMLRPQTFFQATVDAAETLLELLQAGLALSGHERVLDLFCGAGIFTLPLADRAASVTGIELSALAIEDARLSAEINEVENIDFVVAPVERALVNVSGPINAVVLDPPRRGCHPAVLERLLELAVPRMAYVSCHPGTLARDLRILVAGGYHVSLVTPLDLFPQTPHIECVAILER